MPSNKRDTLAVALLPVTTVVGNHVFDLQVLSDGFHWLLTIVVTGSPFGDNSHHFPLYRDDEKDGRDIGPLEVVGLGGLGRADGDTEPFAVGSWFCGSFLSWVGKRRVRDLL